MLQRTRTGSDRLGRGAERASTPTVVAVATAIHRLRDDVFDRLEKRVDFFGRQSSEHKVHRRIIDARTDGRHDLVLVQVNDNTGREHLGANSRRERTGVESHEVRHRRLQVLDELDRKKRHVDVLPDEREEQRAERFAHGCQETVVLSRDTTVRERGGERRRKGLHARWSG